MGDFLRGGKVYCGNRRAHIATAACRCCYCREDKQYPGPDAQGVLRCCSDVAEVVARCFFCRVSNTRRFARANPKSWNVRCLEGLFARLMVRARSAEPRAR